jgi:hypothetical protein
VLVVIASCKDAVLVPGVVVVAIPRCTCRLLCPDPCAFSTLRFLTWCCCCCCCYPILGAAQAAVGHPLTVYGKGGQTRGFLDIRDTGEGRRPVEKGGGDVSRKHHVCLHVPCLCCALP